MSAASVADEAVRPRHRRRHQALSEAAEFEKEDDAEAAAAEKLAA